LTVSRACADAQRQRENETFAFSLKQHERGLAETINTSTANVAHRRVKYVSHVCCRTKHTQQSVCLFVTRGNETSHFRVTCCLLIDCFDVILISHVHDRIGHDELMLRRINTSSDERVRIDIGQMATPADFVPEVGRAPFDRWHRLPLHNERTNVVVARADR
jgi:hypothetical protein